MPCMPVCLFFPSLDDVGVAPSCMLKPCPQHRYACILRAVSCIGCILPCILSSLQVSSQCFAQLPGPLCQHLSIQGVWYRNVTAHCRYLSIRPSRNCMSVVFVPFRTFPLPSIL